MPKIIIIQIFLSLFYTEVFFFNLIIIKLKCSFQFLLVEKADLNKLIKAEIYHHQPLL